MTLQELIQEAQHLSWQEQFHLATRLLQWAEAKMPTQKGKYMDRISCLRIWGNTSIKGPQPLKLQLHPEFNCVHLLNWQPYADRSLVAAAAKAAEASFAEVWDNPEDAAYDDL
jgi:hypothetical protein